MNKTIKYIERKSGKEKEETVYFEQTLRFLYETKLGRFLSTLIAKNSCVSKIFGWWQRQPFTKRKIVPFIKKYGIEASEFKHQPNRFRSFDAFFTRALKKGARPLSHAAIFPADGRYLFYQNIEKSDGFVVKGKKFSLKHLLNDTALAERYRQGSMAIARLCPSDYHRFHFPFDCIPGPAQLINGPLFSVNPIAIRHNLNIFTENKRMITCLRDCQYGETLFVEIGATSVGTIHQTYTPNQSYQKGEEKGYFSFGGSSIILLFEPNRIMFAPDLLKNASQHIETLCTFGDSFEQS